jgi:hypothetical protein
MVMSLQFTLANATGKVQLSDYLKTCGFDMVPWRMVSLLHDFAVLAETVA